MADEVERIRIPYVGGQDRTTTKRHAEATLTMPVTEGQGTPVMRIECGNLVANVFQHSDDPNFTYSIRIEREYLEDGKLKSSTRLTRSDLDTLRHLAGHVRDHLRGRLDPIDRVVRDNEEWAKTDWAKDKGTRRR